MQIERELITAILSLTKQDPAALELVNRKAKAPLSLLGDLLRKMQNDGLVYVKAGSVETDDVQRLKLAFRALELGSDLEAISGLLRWQEFESMTAAALRSNGYDVAQNLRFSHMGKRWEVDVVGCRKPIAICLDCKHWHRGASPGALRRVVEEQVQRTAALAGAIPSPRIHVKCASWEKIEFVPAIVSLPVPRFKFYDSVPIVPVLQLQSFLTELPAQLGSLKHLTKQIAPRVES